MGLFGPKLTREQKEVLRTVADTMNALADKQKDSFERTSAQLQEFGANCVAGQRAGIGRPMHAPADNEIENIRQLLQLQMMTRLRAWCLRVPCRRRL